MQIALFKGKMYFLWLSLFCQHDAFASVKLWEEIVAGRELTDFKVFLNWRRKNNEIDAFTIVASSFCWEKRNFSWLAWRASWYSDTCHLRHAEFVVICSSLSCFKWHFPAAHGCRQLKCKSHLKKHPAPRVLVFKIRSIMVKMKLSAGRVLVLQGEDEARCRACFSLAGWEWS